jgi:hypothetical protein
MFSLKKTSKYETEHDRFQGSKLKIAGEKSSPNPKPLDPKPVDILSETEPLPSLGLLLYSRCAGSLES